jgi:hypothetical protein
MPHSSSSFIGGKSSLHGRGSSFETAIYMNAPNGIPKGLGLLKLTTACLLSISRNEIGVDPARSYKAQAHRGARFPETPHRGDGCRAGPGPYLTLARTR